MLQLEVAAPGRSEQREPGGWGGRGADQGGRLREWCRTWSSGVGDFERSTYHVGKAKIYRAQKRRGNGKCILGSIGVKVFTKPKKMNLKLFTKPKKQLARWTFAVYHRQSLLSPGIIFFTYYPIMPLFIINSTIAMHWRNSSETLVIMVNEL